MNGKIIFVTLLIIQLFSSVLDKSLANFRITRAKSHVDKTGKLTPLVVSVSTDDKKQKIKGVDLIFVVDISGSMGGTRLQLVKDSLNYIVSLMNENDSISIIKFESKASVVCNLTSMTPSNKDSIKQKINSLSVTGGTNIYTGLTLGLQQVQHDYANGDRICSIILLSDGQDGARNADTNFLNLIKTTGKTNYIFTVHTLGYGNSHDAVLMSKIARIRDGGYFFIEKLSNVKEAILQIYGSLSTIFEVDVVLTVQSRFRIDKVYGLEDMYNASLTNTNPYTFKVDIIHFIYGRTYSFVTLVDVPQDTPWGTEILNARITILDKIAYYYWDENFDPYAYEEYIRYIVSGIFKSMYDAGQVKGKQILEDGKTWMTNNYDGIFNWLEEFDKILKDLNNLNTYGKADILSKIHELNSQVIGTHYSDDNSYINTIIDDSYYIDVDNVPIKNSTVETTVNTENNKNYFYYYLKNGKAEINGLHFSEARSSLIIYTDKAETINIKPLTNDFEYYTWSEKKTRIQNQVDPGRGGKFIFKKDLPFDFYVRVDGTEDIIFNIQLLKLEFNQISTEPDHSFELKAFITNENQIKTISSKGATYLPSVTIFNGYYDKGLRFGKILLKKEDISKHLSTNDINNYIYVVLRKTSNSNIVYTNVEGQFSFIRMNYISNYLPESFYVFNNLTPGQKVPDIYAIKMEPTLGKSIRIEFANSGNELDCKVLKHKNYDKGSEEYYSDFEEFNVQRVTHMGKTYIDVIQANDEEDKFDEVIISVFSNNEEHVAGTELTKLAYTIRYTSYSNYGIYDYNDVKEKNGEITIKQNEQNKQSLKVTLYPLQYKKNQDTQYTKENTRFLVKIYGFEKSRQKIYDSISLFEYDTPKIYKEKMTNNESELTFDFTIDITTNYFLTFYTVSEKTNEILAYNYKKLYRYPSNIIIDDDHSYENEYNKDISFDFKVADNISKKNLLIEILDFNEEELGTLQAKIGEKIYKPDVDSNNFITIPKDECKGKTIKLDIKLNDGVDIEYYLSIKLTNQSFAINYDGEINYLKYTKQITLHTDSEYPKAYTLKNGDVLSLSSVIGLQRLKITKLNKEGSHIYGNITMNEGYSLDAQLVQPYNSDYYFLSHHNKKNLEGYESKEYTLTFKDKNLIIDHINRKNSTYQKISVVALKNGKIIVAGINHIPTFGAETVAEINIYNPKSGKVGTGFSFNAYSKYISCYEQKENDVYCVYISFETIFVSKLKIKHINVNGNILTDKGDQTIKALYTEFNYLKAIPFNENEAVILYQTGNGNRIPKYGNDGKNLYLYQLILEDGQYNIKRYEYLYDNCLYDKDKHDPEYYNADIYVLSKNKIFAVCETKANRFRGFIINTHKEEITDFYFNNFNAENVQNPVFAKFGKTLGLFYTHINENLKSKTAYQLINYPDCDDYRNYAILLPKNYMKEFEFMGKVYLSNPYPSDIKEEIKIRFKSYSNITITNIANDANIIPETDYRSSFTLKFMPKDVKGLYDIKYTATRRDSLDGLIVGKTCKISLNTPECLEQCYSCTQKGTEAHHYCLGCIDGPYYEEEDPTAVNEGYGKPHFCKRCDISCSSCYGPLLVGKTTNCKKCDYDNNFFHYEDDERTCISNETKSYWQDALGIVIYLDTSAGPNNKEKWRWRHCHENCAECFEKGDDIDNKCNKCKKDYYFFCNQTVGHGIPGSCHTGCKDNGFYVTIDEDREKCCPCIDHCKECPNGERCDKCYPPFFKTENGTLCNESCGYCLAEDRNIWECVNCKTKYYTPRYTLNKTCVDEIPFIESLQRYHHIVDDKCNLLHGCKEGCYKCSPWYSDNCTSCNSSYYKEDFYGKEEPETFHCFNETTCKGITPYIHDVNLRIGGVPILENDTNVCLNCKLRNDLYRLPEDNFYCGTKITRTYVDIEDYNKLSYCYFRCKECDIWGNSLVMNCTKCRDGKNYKPTKVGEYYNCYKPPPKCGIFPYYHDYDLAEKLGKDEDDCGEDCDVCLYNFTCTETLPYFVYETHECVEYCPMTDILSNKCLLNNTRAGILLLQNPFGLENPYDYLNKSVTLKEIISSKFFSYVASTYDIDVDIVENQINNYLGEGKIYNLPKSQIIIGNNISIELTSVRLELEKLAKLIKGHETAAKNTSIVDLSSCQEVLKKKYNLSAEEDLIMIKGDFLQKLSELYLSNQVEYQLLSTSMGAFLPLTDCKNEGVGVTVTNPFNSGLLFGDYQYKVKQTVEEGYNIFDANSNFYNDICTPFTNENGNDVLLDARRKDYFNQNYNLCENGCKFIGFNETINMYTCNCTVKSAINDQSNYEVTPMAIPDDFFKITSEYSNIKVFKCSSQVFSLKGQKYNFGSYILFTCFVSFIIVIILYFCKGANSLTELFSKFSVVQKENNDNHLANPPKKDDDKEKDEKNEENEQQGGYDMFVKEKEKDPEKIQKNYAISNEDLNLADYNIAKDKDKRTFMQYYWSLIKNKQLFIFTFYTSTDHNLRIVKIALFILFLSFYFAFTALFFNDEIMRQIYTYKGNTNAAIHVTNIIMSSVCCLIMNFIVRLISLNERDIQKINSENNPDNRTALAEKSRRCLKIKLSVLFVVSAILIGICWYYVAAFCAVFKNSQVNYLINVLAAFILCNIWPFITSLFAPIFRIPSIKSGKAECMYKFSQIISYL